MLIEQLNNIANAQIQIAGGGIKVDGFVSSDISIGGGNSFNNPLESMAQQSLSETLQGLQSVASKFGYTGNFTLRSLEQSVLTWTGADIPNFTLRVVFIAIREGDDVRKKALELYKTVYPTSKTAGAATLIVPPLQYLPSGLNARGVFTVKVGKWFKAYNQVMQNVSFSFSKEVTSNGSPVYCEGEISFRPFRTVTSDTIRQYMGL